MAAPVHTLGVRVEYTTEPRRWDSERSGPGFRPAGDVPGEDHDIPPGCRLVAGLHVERPATVVHRVNLAGASEPGAAVGEPTFAQVRLGGQVFLGGQEQSCVQSGVDESAEGRAGNGPVAEHRRTRKLGHDQQE